MLRYSSKTSGPAAGVHQAMRVADRFGAQRPRQPNADSRTEPARVPADQTGGGREMLAGTAGRPRAARRGRSHSRPAAGRGEASS